METGHCTIHVSQWCPLSKLFTIAILSTRVYGDDSDIVWVSPVSNGTSVVRYDMEGFPVCGVVPWDIPTVTAGETGYSRVILCILIRATTKLVLHLKAKAALTPLYQKKQWKIDIAPVQGVRVGPCIPLSPSTKLTWPGQGVNMGAQGKYLPEQDRFRQVPRVSSGRLPCFAPAGGNSLLLHISQTQLCPTSSHTERESGGSVPSAGNRNLSLSHSLRSFHTTEQRQRHLGSMKARLE